MKIKTPKLELIALSHYASFTKSGGLSVIDIFDEIYADSLPTDFPRCFLALILSDTRPKSSLFFQVKISKETGETILEKDVFLQVGSNGKSNFIMELVNMNFEKKGWYKVEVSINKIKIGETRFEVVLSQKVLPRKKRKELLN